MEKENFIQKANEVHDNVYDYSKVNYVNSRHKVEIICPKHGPFLQSPYAHLNSRGCPKCGTEKRSTNQAISTTEFIDKANKVHNGKYTYEKVDYVNNHTKIWITCPIHGDFMQTPITHLHGHGCPKCAFNKQWYTKEFFEKAKKIHKGKYSYDNVRYVNAHTPIMITCPIHGDFIQTPFTHLHGHGCPKCIKEKTLNKYDFSKVKYKNGRTKRSFICSKQGELPKEEIKKTK